MEDNLIRITEHAYCRMKQRNGWNRKTADRMIDRIYDNGKRMEQVKGYVKLWLKDKVSTDPYGNDFVLYGQTVYVFRENALITVLHIPTREYVTGMHS